MKNYAHAQASTRCLGATKTKGAIAGGHHGQPQADADTAPTPANTADPALVLITIAQTPLKQ